MNPPAPSTPSELPPVAILCGGLGTRLRTAVADRPKALALIAGRPFLSWLLDLLDAQGFSRVVLCTGYGADQIEAEFGPTYKGLHLLHSCEPAPLGTGGALRHALPLIGSDAVLIVNGDSYCQTDLGEFCCEQAATGVAASMILSRVDDASRFGSVQRADDGFVTAFQEKSASAGAGWINAGIYLVRGDLLAAIAPGTACSLERDIFPGWIGRGLLGVKSTGPFIDIGTPESYAAAQEFFLSLPGATPVQSTPSTASIGDAA